MLSEAILLLTRLPFLTGVFKMSNFDLNENLQILTLPTKIIKKYLEILLSVSV